MNKIIAINIDGVESINNIFVGDKFNIEIVNPPIDSLADISVNDTVILENSAKKITIITKFISSLENKFILEKELECNYYFGFTQSYSSNYVGIDDIKYNSFIYDVLYNYEKDININLRDEYIEYIDECRYNNKKSGDPYADMLDDEKINSAFKSFTNEKYDKFFNCIDINIITSFYEGITADSPYGRYKSPLVIYIDFLCSRDFFSRRKTPIVKNDNIPMLQIINDDLNDNYSEDELAAILNDWYINAEDDQTTPIRAFGLKYGKYISNSSEIVNKAPDVNTSYKAEVNKGVNLYKAINSCKYGLSFYKPNLKIEEKKDGEVSLQQIYYGAPGTGKSYKTNEVAKQYDTIRTTFHPDSDYSTFVGAYKPTMIHADFRDVTGKVINEDGKKVTEEKIIYKFVPQAFIKAYVKAWKLMAEAKKNNNDIKPCFLVIEEINRGNCAQIFGDLFQLLDRSRNGFSSYYIIPDSDIQQFLKEDKDYRFGDDFVVDDVYNDDGDNIIATNEQIKNGEKLVLPSNLYIWATMNTSDQSLFPIDSAFKRRWEWKYIKITNANKDWKIEINDNGESYDWWNFLEQINKLISSMTSSADKQLGYFFCKADKEKEAGSEPSIIKVETFVGKVLFYLWNDVFKDYGFDFGDLFKYKKIEGDGQKTVCDLSFPDFYKEDNKVNTDVVKQFIQKVFDWKPDDEK